MNYYPLDGSIFVQIFHMDKFLSNANNPFIKNNVSLIGNETSEKTLIFVHGFGNDQTVWHKIIPAFNNKYRIVLIDNVGASKANRVYFSKSRYRKLDKYADDLLDICDSLKMREAVIIGHSAGAMISILSAIRAPECFSKIITIGASPRYLNDVDYYGGFTISDIRDTYDAIQNNQTEWAASFSKIAMQNQHKPKLAEEFAKKLSEIPIDLAITVLHSIFQTDYREEVSKLELPTLIIQSKNDVFVPAQVAEFLHQKIINSKLVTIDASGHLPHVSAPDSLVSAILDFL